MKKWIIALFAGMVMTGCYYDTEQLLYPNSQNCTGVTPSFSADVAPLVQTRCALGGCHAAGSVNTGGSLTNYSEIQSKSSLIRISVANGSMPQGSSLSTAELKTIMCWIDSGSPNN